MVFRRKFPKPKFTEEQLADLGKIRNSRSEERRRVIRAGIILDYIADLSDEVIARKNHVNKNTVKNTLSKLREFGIDSALGDLPRPGKPRRITDDDKAWVLNLACTKPSEHGYPNELWTYSLLTSHARMSRPSLRDVSRSTIHDILTLAAIRPHRIRYYVENRDEDFENKMATILHVYKEVEIVNSGSAEDGLKDTITISFDEKPGIQALSLKSEELPPVPGKYPSVTRDYEYRRLGTLSLLAGLNLHSGKVTEITSRTHNSDDFIRFLKKLDSSYPKEITLRLILDNLRVHTSEKTREYLATVPNRFVFVFTPKHGSWLNIVETLFSKITRTLLKEIRVERFEELKERIDQYFDELNRSPVIFRWTYKMDETVIA